MKPMVNSIIIIIPILGLIVFTIFGILAHIETSQMKAEIRNIENQGDKLFSAGRYSEAIKIDSKVQTVDERNIYTSIGKQKAKVFCKMGISLIHQGKKEEAVNKFKKAIRCDFDVDITSIEFYNYKDESGRELFSIAKPIAKPIAKDQRIGPAHLKDLRKFERRFIKKHNICGREYVNKSVEKFIGEEELSLLIYLLQDKDIPNKLKVVVSQKNDYSIDEIVIKSDLLDNPITIWGEGDIWGDKIYNLFLSSAFDAPNKTYEKYIIITNESFKLPAAFNIRVTYLWAEYSGKKS